MNFFRIAPIWLAKSKNKEVKHCLKFDGLLMTLLEIPVPDPRNPSSMKSMPGLRMSAITEVVDLVEHFEGSETRLRKMETILHISLTNFMQDSSY